MTAPLDTPTLAGTGGDPKGPLSVRLLPEQRAALEYLASLFPDRYRGLGAVLNDYSLEQAVDVHRRAVALAAVSAS